MSFVCQICDEPQKDRVKPILVAVEQRSKTYPVRRNEEDKVVDKGGSGYETVREVQACKQCALNWITEHEEKEK